MRTAFAHLITEYNNSDNCYETENVFEYSGRSMYGKTTDAIKVDNLHHFHSIVSEIIEDAAENQDTETLHLIAQGIKNLHFDKLGYGMVVY